MSRRGHSNQATQGSNSNAQGRNNGPGPTYQEGTRVPNDPQAARLTTANVQNHGYGGMPGTAGQGNMYGVPGSQHASNAQGEHVPYYVGRDRVDQAEYNDQRVNHQPNPRQGQPMPAPYQDYGVGGQYGAPQQQLQGQGHGQQNQHQDPYSYATREYVDSSRGDDPYGDSSNRRDRQAYLDEFDETWEGGDGR